MKKLILSFVIIIIALGCEGEEHVPKRNDSTEIQSLIDSCGLIGSVLIFDDAKNEYVSNDYKWSSKGQLPASTFKIANSIVGLEAGLLKNDSSIMKSDGKKYNYKIWEQDLPLKDAIKYSCVPCYQELARAVGLERMKTTVGKLNYGKMDITTETLDNFWLRGKSRITPFEEIDFLIRLNNQKLPVAKKSMEITKSIILQEDEGDFKLYGKTGWSGGGEEGIDNGWFVGFLEKGDNTYYLATNVSKGKDFDMNNFPRIRKELTVLVLKRLGYM